MLAQIQAMFAVVDLGKINWNQFLEKYLEIATGKNINYRNWNTPIYVKGE